jgi:hypothetical protein
VIEAPDEATKDAAAFIAAGCEFVIFLGIEVRKAIGEEQLGIDFVERTSRGPQKSHIIDPSSTSVFLRVPRRGKMK